MNTLSSASKLRLNISPPDEDEFISWGDEHEFGFSTQLSGHGLSRLDSSLDNSKSSAFGRRRQQQRHHELLPSLLTRHKVRKEPPPIGNNGEEFYINYLKDRIQREDEDARRNKQLNAQRVIRNKARSTTTVANNRIRGEEERKTPHTAQSSPELDTPIVRPFANNRFRLRTQNSFSSKISKSQNFDTTSSEKQTKKKPRRTKDSNYTMAKTKTIIDLNAIGIDNSALTEHYLLDNEDEVYRQHHQRLGDLRLSEMWPRSTMCKLSQRASPWVRAQREKSLAIELNSYFRFSSSSDLATTSNAPNLFYNHFPVIKQNESTSYCVFPSFKNTI